MTQVAEAPTPVSGTKHPIREAEGPPQFKHLVDNASTPLIQDHLGRLVSALSSRLTSSSSWRDFIHEHQGKSYLAPNLDHIVHSVHDYLQELRDHGMGDQEACLSWIIKSRCSANCPRVATHKQANQVLVAQVHMLMDTCGVPANN